MTGLRCFDGDGPDKEDEMDDKTAFSEWSLWNFADKVLLIATDDLSGKPAILTAFVEVRSDGGSIIATSNSPTATVFNLEGEGGYPEAHAAVLENCVALYAVETSTVTRIAPERTVAVTENTLKRA
jgi:hypothetical protein